VDEQAILVRGRKPATLQDAKRRFIFFPAVARCWYMSASGGSVMTPIRTVLMLSLLAPAAVAFARCGDDAADQFELAFARAQVAADCPCATAPDHRTHVRCADGIATMRVENGILSSACRRVVKRCAARSTCGRGPGFVACCRNGTRCHVRRSAAACTADGGAPAACPSCCDACTGCPTTTTSTSTTTTTLNLAQCGRVEGECLGACPAATPICADVGGVCQCTAGTTACGPLGAPECDGVCAPNEVCFPGGGGTCGCISVDATPCALTEYPSCGTADCPDAQTCIAVPVPSGTICVCPPLPCSGGAYPTCAGSCPPGGTCTPISTPPIQGCICL
jgi:hypothetical protein